MATINKYGITFHSDFKLLFPQFSAITLFGHVFMRRSFKEMEQYLDTHRGKVMANHEKIHMIQASTFKTRYFGFYMYYIGYWIKNLFTKGFSMNAYYNIPFEKEAYQNENNFGYNESMWENYK